MTFEKAYLFYRKKNDKAALGVIRKLDGNNAHVMELKAQIFYRMEEYQEALELFKILVRTHSDEFDDIRRANMAAVKARLQTQKIAQELDLTHLDSFELMFNASCHLIACEKLEEALRLLDKTLVYCERTLTEDGLSKTEIAQESAPILTQKAFVLQKLGKKKAALKIYQQVLKTKALSWKLKSIINENLEVDFVRFGRRWKPIKERSTAEAMEIDGGEIVAAYAAARKRKLRKKKSRLPANYNPEIPPDPERWLPRQERTAYRKKVHKKFKDRDIGRGTQGAAAGSAANIDYSGNAKPGTSGGPLTGNSPHPSPKPTEGPRQQRPTQQAKKGKKKKGGKW